MSLYITLLHLVYLGWEIILFDSINSLQGVFIFLVLICKPRMRNIVRVSTTTTFLIVFDTRKKI